MNIADDPYVMLAFYLLSTSTKGDINRILTENDYIKKLIIKEVRNMDLCGAFVDAVTETILTDGERMELMGKLDELSSYYYTKLDRKRLRANIVKYAKEYDLMEL